MQKLAIFLVSLVLILICFLFFTCLLTEVDKQNHVEGFAENMDEDDENPEYDVESSGVRSFSFESRFR